MSTADSNAGMRKEGYYWVKIGTGDWETAFFNCNTSEWKVLGSEESWGNKHFTEINETRIPPPRNPIPQKDRVGIGRKRLDVPLTRVKLLRNKGWSFRKIEKELGISHATLLRRIKEN